MSADFPWLKQSGTEYIADDGDLLKYGGYVKNTIGSWVIIPSGAAIDRTTFKPVTFLSMGAKLGWEATIGGITYRIIN